MDWRQFVMDLGTLNPDMVEAVLARHGAQSVTLSDASDTPVLEPAPGETPLWKRTRITGLFSGDADFAALEEDLKSELGLPDLPAFEITDLPDRVWEREWLNDFGPMQFGERLWICPTGTNVDDESAVVIDLDPGLAFGTGTHATTALCLEWLDTVDLQGKSLLDFGCGSGVIAIAGLKLGCRNAVGVDIDLQALRASEENATRNRVREKLILRQDADQVHEQFDVVVANILAAPLIELAEPISGYVKSGCSLALSGILSEQVEEVLGAYGPWIAFDEPAVREQGGQTWARLTGLRTGG